MRRLCLFLVRQGFDGQKGVGASGLNKVENPFPIRKSKKPNENDSQHVGSPLQKLSNGTGGVDHLVRHPKNQIPNTSLSLSVQQPGSSLQIWKFKALLKNSAR